MTEPTFKASAAPVGTTELVSLCGPREYARACTARNRYLLNLIADVRYPLSATVTFVAPDTVQVTLPNGYSEVISIERAA